MAREGVAWLAREFQGVALGDERLNRRCVETVRTLGRKPGKSIPRACEDWGESKGVYRFLSNKKVTHGALLAPHQKKTAERCKAASEVVVAHDTTYVNLTAHRATKGLGPIGETERMQGFLVHHALAMDGKTGEVLGLLHQESWARDGFLPKEETGRRRRKRPRESERWRRGIEAVRALGLKNVIHVSDRESDIYEVLKLLVMAQARYVIRASWNRSLEDRPGFLIDAVKREPVKGRLKVEVSAHEGRKARTAVVSLRRARVTIRPPNAVGLYEEPLDVTVVRASEDHPPEGVEGLEWNLLTSEPAETAKALARVVRLYTRRWTVEEFHMGLKTGCRLQERQFKTRQRIEAFLGLASVISVMMLRLRGGARGEAGAGRYLTESQLECLRSKRPEIGSRPTAREALRAVAKLGGFLARKSDGEPGWRTIWRGMEQLLFIEHGYLAAMKQFQRLLGSPNCG